MDPVLRINIPDAPYCYIEAPLPMGDQEDAHEAVMQALGIAQHIREQYIATFGAPQQGGHLVNAAQERGAQPQSQGYRKVWGYCPQHPDVAAVESQPKYQTYDEGPNGERLPAKFFCPGRENGTGQNHSIWRSQLVQPFGDDDGIF